MLETSELQSPAVGLVQRVREHARIPLYREGYALVASSAVTSVFGLVYWVVAARSYSPHIVGLNSAAISAMLFISGLAQLNVSSALMRFLPVAGPKARSFIVLAYLIPAGVAAAASAIFLIGLDLWTPQLEFLTSSLGFAVWFVAAVVGWNVFVVQDAILTGFRRALWVCADATLFSVTKVVLLIALAAPLPAYGIFASWTIAIAASVVPINALIFGRLLSRHRSRSRSDGSALTVRGVVQFAGLDYVGWLSNLATVSLIPLVITAQAGPSQNAFFSLAYALVVPLYLVSTNMGMSLVVSVASDEGHFDVYMRRALVQTLRLAVPLALLGFGAAPYLLRLFGDAYVDEGTATLRLLMLSGIPNTVTSLYIYACRAQRRMRRVAATLVSQSALVFGLSVLLLDVWEIAGVGAAFLIGQAAVAGVVLVRLLPGLMSADPTER